METQVRTPQMVFMQPQRLVVPLFQRPYVWNEENQWEPLWNDITRIADRVLHRPYDRHAPHFLGAVVLQQVQQQTGQMQARTIIDGQQRLTTLQILLDALHGELLSVGAKAPAMRIEPLVANAEAFCSKQEDRFKVWPTNRDRPAFNAVMAAPPPVDYESTGYKGERMVEAHCYFSSRAREWLSSGDEESTAARAATIETVVRELLQMVVIDLTVDENAQEIFETLNARGAQLTAADLIKNFIFQKLLEDGANVEEIYQTRWKEFETGFWESEISVGRFLYPRSSIFLNHWLVARTGEEVVAREVFNRFKRYCTHDVSLPMDKIIVQVHQASLSYRQFITTASSHSGAINRLGLFGYRTGVLESEVVKPLVLCLLDPEKAIIPEAQLTKALDSVESWMVRRMLVRATTKNYNLVFAELVSLILGENRQNSGDVIEKFLASQSSASRYWPDDNDIRQELSSLMAYRSLRRGRLRMILEAIEDHKRGWRGGNQGLGGERVARGKYAIEHIMPSKWITHWPLSPTVNDSERDRNIHTLGNLTLLTKKLNSKISNGPWLGSHGKRKCLEAHDVLILNRELLKNAGDDWTDSAIQQRTLDLANAIIEIWPVPPHHKSGFAADKAIKRKEVQLSDLISSGFLSPGTPLFPRKEKYGERVATLLPEGQIEIEGIVFGSPSPAASHIAGKSTNGWWFFLIDQSSKTSLRDVRRSYIDRMAVDAEDDELDDDEDDGS